MIDNCYYRMYNLCIKELEPYYFPTKLSGPSYPLFHLSLAYNKYKASFDNWNVYDQVLPYIYLGRIPENNNYPDRTKLIISAVTYGELAEVNFDYGLLEKLGIRHLFINMEDFTSDVSNTAIINSIKLIESYVESNNIECIQKGWKVFVENFMPDDLDNYRSSYILLLSEMDMKKIGSMKYVRSDGLIEDVIIHNFENFYDLSLLSVEIGERVFILSENDIMTHTNHRPSCCRDSNVYIHCKAGRARSGMILAIYMAYHSLKNIQNIDHDTIDNELNKSIDLLKSHRQQVDIGINKRGKAIEILIELLNIKYKIQFKYDNPLLYLMSLDFKNEVCQFPSFKKLCTYLSGLRDTQSRAQKIQDFLSQILYANTQDAVTEWYTFNLLNQLKDCQPNPFKTNDRELRFELVDSLISEIKTHVAYKYTF